MTTNSERYIAFRLEAEVFAAPLSSVREVLAIPEITPLPQSPSYFLGIMNLRGQVISVLDLRLKLGLKSTRTEETCIIIFEIGRTSVGVIVDEVRSVLSLKDGELADPPESPQGKKAAYIVGIINRGAEMVLAIDVAKALDINDQQLIGKIAQSKAA